MSDSIKTLYQKMEDEIEQRWLTFNETWRIGGNEIWAEMVMCLCTPQTKAEKGWSAARKIAFTPPGTLDLITITNILTEEGIRFKNKKASYIYEASNKYSDTDIKEELIDLIMPKDTIEVRNILAKNVKGFGMKEASHFLRNIGFGDDIAILDRHILRQLYKYNVINKIPEKLNNKLYLEIEQKMIQYSKQINIPLFALDFVFWAETHDGKIFK